MRFCRVLRCRINHSKHFCRLCKEENTDHFSSDCPNGRTLYHGTHISAIPPVARGGSNESEKGRLGPGVYFVKTYDEAKQISKNQRNSNHTVVFECRVNCHLGNKKDNSWQICYDSACGIHPP